MNLEMEVDGLPPADPDEVLSVITPMGRSTAPYPPALVRAGAMTLTKKIKEESK
jgi:hypothetical protein